MGPSPTATMPPPPPLVSRQKQTNEARGENRRERHRRTKKWDEALIIASPQSGYLHPKPPTPAPLFRPFRRLPLLPYCMITNQCSINVLQYTVRKWLKVSIEYWTPGLKKRKTSCSKSNVTCTRATIGVDWIGLERSRSGRQIIRVLVLALPQFVLWLAVPNREGTKEGTKRITTLFHHLVAFVLLASLLKLRFVYRKPKLAVAVYEKVH